MKLRQIPTEAIVWSAGLIFLALYPPTGHSHFTVCPLALLGADWCPGCGLGQSISWLFRGEWQRSFNTHPLGIFAVIILSFRIITLLKKYLNYYGKSN